MCFVVLSVIVNWVVDVQSIDIFKLRIDRFWQ